MPEGPSIVILRDEVQRFAGRRIVEASGNSRIDLARLEGARVSEFRSWGKHFLIALPGHALRVHFLMFGSWTIDERKARDPRLRLRFARGGELNLYSCAIREIEGPLDEAYDWRADVMSDAWSPRAALRKLRAAPGTPVCDALLDQQVFAGVGNIIKNEVLFRIRVHPLAPVGALPTAKLRALVREARNYSFDFLEWKKAFVLRQNWLVHNKSTCPRCGDRLERAYLGATDRRTFFCARDQALYGTPAQKRAAARALASARRAGKRLVAVAGASTAE